MSGSARPSRSPLRRTLIVLAVVLGILIAVPVLALGGALLYANTEGGRATLARLVAGQVPGLTVEGLEGPLPGRLGLGRITLADKDGIWLEAEGIRLAWDPWALLRREAHILSAGAERVAVLRLPQSDAQPAPREPGPLIPEVPSLPVAVRLDALRIERLEIAEPVAGEAATLRAAASGSLDAGGLVAEAQVDRLDQEAALRLDLAMTPGTDRLHAAATLREAPGGLIARLAGRPGEAATLDLRLDGPPAGADLTVQAGIGPGVALDLRGTVSAGAGGAIGARIGGTVEAAGLLPPALAAPLGRAEVALDAARSPAGIVALREFVVEAVAGRVRASGQVDTGAETAALDFRADVAPSETLASLLPDGVARWDALQLEGRAEGPLAAPRVTLDAATSGFGSSIAPLAALLGDAPRLSARATAPDRIESLVLEGTALRASLSGQVGEVLDLALEGALGSLAGAAQGVEGALAFSARVQGPATDPAVSLRAQSDGLTAAGQRIEALALDAEVANPATALAARATLSGRYQDLPLEAELRAAPEGEWVRLDAATARIGPAQISASGRVNPGALLAEGQVALDAPDLAPFAPLIGQPVRGAVRLRATLEPRDGKQGVDARLETPGLTASGVVVERLALTAAGTPDAMDLTLAGRVQQVALDARARVTQPEEGAIRLELPSLRAEAHGETLRLAAPARITRRPDGAVEIGSLSLARTGGGTLTAEGVWGPERADLRARLAALPLSALSGFLPEVRPAGTASGDIRVTGSVAAPQVNAELRGQGLRAGAPWANGLPPVNLNVQATRAGSGAVEARAEAVGGNALRLQAALRMPRGPGQAAPVEARLDGRVDLGAVAGPLLAAGADRVSGRLDLALRAGGTTAAPRLDGEARLTGGSWRNGAIGAAVTDLAGTIRAEGTRLRVDLAGRSTGDGRIALRGAVDPLSPGLPVDLALTAAAARPVASELVTATVDADLRLTGEVLGAGARLAGPVRIRRADVNLPARLPVTVRTLGEVTERGRLPAGRPRPAPRAPRGAPAETGLPPIALAIAVQAQRVFVRGRGVDAELAGDVTVAGTLAEPELTGDLDLRRGQIEVLARRLDFRRGRLAFDGALMPSLDLLANTRAGGTEIRVAVTGPPTAPEITFSSQPELPQDEVLARLLFDRPTRDLGPLETAQIAAALAGAAGIGGDGAGGILDRVRRTLGLDRLAVSGGDEAGRQNGQEGRGGPTVEAGRYVANGVFVGVRQGTDPGSARAGVRVDLTPRLKLEAETGDREAGERLGLTWEYEW